MDVFHDITHRGMFVAKVYGFSCFVSYGKRFECNKEASLRSLTVFFLKCALFGNGQESSDGEVVISPSFIKNRGFIQDMIQNSEDTKQNKTKQNQKKERNQVKKQITNHRLTALYYSISFVLISVK